MSTSKRREGVYQAVLVAHFPLLYAGYTLESPIVVLTGSLILIAFAILVTWYSALRRLRLVRDTPTSRIASAAQGYVELIGTGKPLGNTLLLGKFSQLPCLWYHYTIEHESRDRDGDTTWVVDEQGQSDQPFLIDDGSGTCVIVPRGAEVAARHENVTYERNWILRDRRFTERTLLEGDMIYAIGHFHTAADSSVELNFNEEVENVLDEWEQDMPDLHRRFDLDNNGKLDTKEWMLARLAAKREARKRVESARNPPDKNYLLQPKDGRLFLISNRSQEELQRGYGCSLWGYLIMLFAILAGGGWLLNLLLFHRY